MNRKQIADKLEAVILGVEYVSNRVNPVWYLTEYLKKRKQQRAALVQTNPAELAAAEDAAYRYHIKCEYARIIEEEKQVSEWARLRARYSTNPHQQERLH